MRLKFVKMCLLIQNLDIISIKIVRMFQTMLVNDRILISVPSNMISNVLLNSGF